ncbi:MAG: hypothetical protein ACKOX3_11120, partial [Bacteroidota bacterium]
MQSNQLRDLFINQLGSDISTHPNFELVIQTMTSHFDDIKIQNELLERSSTASIDAYNKLLFINKQLSNEISFLNQKTKNLLITIAKEKGTAINEYSTLQLDETFQILQNEIFKWKTLEDKHKQNLATLEK